MRVWRFHRDIYGPLDTTESLSYGGRWNPRGTTVLYMSASFAGGMLELLAHSTHPRRPPKNHVASLIEIPDIGGMAVLEPPYPDEWDHPTDYSVGVGLARSWLTAGNDLCLEVPSVAGSPIERNIVINARHRFFQQLTPIRKIRPIYDPRIWG